MTTAAPPRPLTLVPPAHDHWLDDDDLPGPCDDELLEEEPLPAAARRSLGDRTLGLRALPARVATRVHGGDPEAGMSTAEYAVGTVAACGFGGVLYKIITSSQVLELMRGVIAKALKVSF